MCVWGGSWDGVTTGCLRDLWTLLLRNSLASWGSVGAFWNLPWRACLLSVGGEPGVSWAHKDGFHWEFAVIKVLPEDGDCVSVAFLSCHNSSGRWGLVPETGGPQPAPLSQLGWGDRSNSGSAPILMSSCQHPQHRSGARKEVSSDRRWGARAEVLILWHSFLFFPLSRQLGLDSGLVAPPREVGALLPP